MLLAHVDLVDSHLTRGVSPLYLSGLTAGMLLPLLARALRAVLAVPHSRWDSFQADTCSVVPGAAANGLIADHQIPVIWIAAHLAALGQVHVQRPVHRPLPILLCCMGIMETEVERGRLYHGAYIMMRGCHRCHKFWNEDEGL